MGNRGDLHNADGTIGRTWRLTRWISCTLHSLTGGRVTFDTPGRYTPLFFLDEATALAAGHRPCAYCRRPAYDRFRDTWQDVFGTRPSADEIDQVLHRHRIDGEGRKVTFEAWLSKVPSGTFIAAPVAPLVAQLWSSRQLRTWSHAGYDEAVTPENDHLVKVLTPAPIVQLLRHSSASLLGP